MVDSELVALVTGANRGLGRETARQLAGKGIAVLLGARDAERGAAVAAELAAEGGSVTAIPLDVTDEAGVAAVAARIRDRWGRLDVLVNNAGAFRPATAVETTAAPLRDIFEVNVYGVVTVTHAVLPLLARSAAPRIVNVSSTTASLTLTAAGESLPGNAAVRMAYTASKAALNMLTIQYARAFRLDPELAHLKINSATPGYTATDMNQHQGIRSVHDGARAIVELATLPADGPTGGFFNDEGPVPW
ncbi:short-chain dehydrogenase [Actinoplanes cyaneus]|uniref:Short-chain dehydrogenase n=1 Tax=Actinoplanes cyaneus TaxID=52696 RepID=A0A919M5R5_9ACTN|nr:SDR family NAD(P)-dependent oxidoreductase [Actinoplanes cyaneus]MCW2144039.1 Short-chain dehydrogenase [Actinoplanes cyaneus]GID70745.1 short-chain dehydrogenase [Actinoplanes cyaneus]